MSAKGLTVKEVAQRLGVGNQQAVKLILRAVKSKLIPNQVTKDGSKNLYSVEMIDKLISARRENKLGVPRLKSRLNDGKSLVIPVEINDSELAEILMHRFGSTRAISSYLQTYLESDAKTVKAEIMKIKMDADAKTKRLLQSKKLFSTP